MRFFSFLVTFAITGFLAACGGGGGAPGIPSKTPNPITAPTELTLKVTGTSGFVITGGSAPFQLKIGNEQIATVSWNSANVTLYGISSGETELLITDASLQTATVIVKVANLAEFFTTAPAALTMTPGSIFRDYIIGGGQPPYVVSSDNTDVVSVVGSSGTLLRVTPGKVGSANVTVSDSATPARASVTILVTVKSLLPLSVSPESATSYIDMPVDVYVTGGTPPYRVGGVIPAAIRVTPSSSSTDPSKFVVTPLLATDTTGFDITFIDSQNEVVTFNLVGSAGTPTIRLSPSLLTVSETDTQPINLTVFGATGELAAFSSDTGLFQAAVSGAGVTVTTGSIGNRCVVADTPVTITVVDSTRATGTSIITIMGSANNCAMTVLPSTLTLAAPVGGGAATTATASILQGTSPYFVSSSDSSVVTVAVAGSTVTVTRVAAGSATITVTDSSLRTATIMVTAN